MMDLGTFAEIKTLCSAIGLVIFMTVFISAVVWVYRPGAKKSYQKLASKILEE